MALNLCILSHIYAYLVIFRGTDFPRSRNRGRKRGKAYLKRNSRFSPKTLLVTFKKHTLLSKRTFQRHFQNRNSRYLTRGTDFPRSRNRGRNRGKAYLKRNSRFSAKTLLITSKKHTLLSKRNFQCHFENRNGQYLTTLICVSVTPN